MITRHIAFFIRDNERMLELSLCRDGNPIALVVLPCMEGCEEDTLRFANAAADLFIKQENERDRTS